MTALSRRWLAVTFALLAPLCVAGETGAEGTSAGSLVLVAGGTYRQGDERGDGYPDERPARLVTLASFLLSPTEVTFAEYDLFCVETRRDKPDDNGWGRGQRPVIYVSWVDAAEYCNWLSGKEGLKPFYGIRASTVTADWTAHGYRLPTEAEWEYAARGGPASTAPGSGPAPALGSIAWYSANSGGTTHPVREKLSNALGLFDMAGNVWEWCNDWYAPYAAADASDPRGPESGQYRALRGGSWYDTHAQRWSARTRHPPAMRLPMLGFRVARTPDAAS
jgi:formylglycine-generating enzyme